MRKILLSIKINEMVPKTNIDEMAMTLPLAEIQRWVSQSLIVGPNNLLFRRRACHLGDDLAKHHADSKTKQVVGNKGKNAPIIPTTKEIMPMIL